MVKVALYKPEIAGNVGSIIRTCACFGADLEIIEPCGFPFDMNRIKKSALDYIHHVKITRHNSFDEFYQKEVLKNDKRLVLATTKSQENYLDFSFAENDILLFGQESAGVPEEIHQKCQEKVTIKMKNEMRSLNLAVSCAIILSFANS